jgi:O-antigen ligase
VENISLYVNEKVDFTGKRLGMAAASIPHSYKKDRERGNKGDKDRSLLYWLSLALITVFLFVWLFQTGLFYGYTVQYEYALNSALFWAGIMLFVLSIYQAYHWKLTDVSDVLGLWIWTIPAAYILASVHAVSSHYASSMIMLNVMYSIFFVLAVAFAKNKLGARIIQNGIVLAGYVAVIYCFMNMFGNAYFRDAVMLSDQGLRLTSVFQYANAYAAYLLAILLSALWLLMNERKWYVVSIHAVMVVPLLVSFLLTLSRGGLVVLPLIALAILPFFRFAQQICFFVYAMIGAVGALLILEPIRSLTTRIFQQVTSGDPLQPALLSLFDSESLKGWLIVGSVSIVVGLVITVIQRYVVPKLEQRTLAINKYRIANLFIPIILIVAGLFGAILLSGNNFVSRLLPVELQTRLQSINFQQHSVLERLTMYKDSMKLVSDYPITGAGGGAWTILYQQYQNNPYIVKQVHNFFLQYWVETGLIGLLVLTALLIAIYYLYIRQYFKQNIEDRGSYQVFYIVSVSILIHSLLDFEMSYAYLASVVFLSLGGLAAGLRFVPSFIKEKTWIGRINLGKARLIYPLVIGVVSIVVMVSGLKELNGNRQYMATLEKLQSSEQVRFEDVMKPMNAALAATPAHPDYVNLKLSLLYQAYNQSKNANLYEEAKTYLELLKQKEPYNKESLETEYNQYITEGKLNEALAVTERNLRNNSWGINIRPGGQNWYERAIGLYAELGDRARTDNNKELNGKLWNQAVETYQQVLIRKESLKSLPKGQMQGEPFDVTPGISLAIGKIFAERQDYKGAVDVLRVNAGLQSDAPISRMILRWYLAALQKLGQNDQQIYDSFTAKFPEEKTEIAKLAASI